MASAASNTIADKLGEAEVGARHTPGPWAAGQTEYQRELGQWSIGRSLDDTIGVSGLLPFDAGDGGYMLLSGVCSREDAYLIAAAPDTLEALDPINVRTAAKLLTEAGHGLHAGLLILMADAQERAISKALGQ